MDYQRLTVDDVKPLKFRNVVLCEPSSEPVSGIRLPQGVVSLHDHISMDDYPPITSYCATEDDRFRLFESFRRSQFTPGHPIQFHWGDTTVGKVAYSINYIRVLRMFFVATFDWPAPSGVGVNLGLKPRLQRVLDVAMQGRTVAQMSRELGLTPATVTNYMGEIRRHFGVSSDLMLGALIGDRDRIVP